MGMAKNGQVALGSERQDDQEGHELFGSLALLLVCNCLLK